ncbi:MAG: hypothetical protein IKX40_08080 [Thermoguttaceae bacterium]|nr:hypothetical protein [Thermoguttaceae bacterium]
MAFKAKRPVIIAIQSQHVEKILAGTKAWELGRGLIRDCNCFVIYRSRENRGIVAIAEIGETRPSKYKAGGYDYHILKVYVFKEGKLSLDTAFENTPIKRKFNVPQAFTYLRNIDDYWTPETEAAAAEAVKILLKTHPYKIVYPKDID